MATLCLFSFLIILALPSLAPVSAGLILEEGYTVTTVIDGHKLDINPHSVFSTPQSSDLILLDSSHSILYTVSFPISQESVIKRLAGDGVAGLSDGEPGSARFNKPRSFAVDNKGNIYVADRINGAIRKVTTSGVSTISGGYSKGVGREDGPAQNATFSSDFDVVFVAQECALLISDHGNQLVRRIGLKPEDCATNSHSALGAVPFWVLGPGLLFSCLVGIAIGFVIRHFMLPREGSFLLQSSMTWNVCLMNLVRPVLMFCFAIKNAVARSSLYALMSRLLRMSLSHLLLISRVSTVGPQISSKGINVQTSSRSFVSLLDSDVHSSEVETSQLCAELNDMLSYSSPPQLSNSVNEIYSVGEQDQLGTDVSMNVNRRIDTMIQANIIGFAKDKVAEEATPVDRTPVGIRGLVKRR